VRTKSLPFFGMKWYGYQSHAHYTAIAGKRKHERLDLSLPPVIKYGGSRNNQRGETI
jgi:hypothetical protein